MSTPDNREMEPHIEDGPVELRPEDSVTFLIDAARVLNVSTDWLLGLTDNPAPAGQRGFHMSDHAGSTLKE